MAEMIKNEAGFAQTKIEVAKKVGDKRQKVGEIMIYVPTLESFGIAAEIKSIDEDDGLPIYADEKHDYLFGAVIAAVKAKARNSLVSGTADLKPGVTIPANFAELLAESGRGAGGAEALATVRELKAKMGFWLASVEKKSAGTQAFINGLFANRQALSLQSEVNRGKMTDYIGKFAEWLADDNLELLEKGQKYINSLLEAAQAATAADDF